MVEHSPQILVYTRNEQKKRCPAENQVFDDLTVVLVSLAVVLVSPSCCTKAECCENYSTNFFENCITNVYILLCFVLD